MDKPGYIVPPPDLIPSRPPAEPAPPPLVRPLPAFRPAGPHPEPAGEEAAGGWRLVLPGGRRVPVTGAVLLGRNPSAAAHAGGAELIALEDPTSTVSKTHALVEPAGEGLRVVDLHSTNGVVVAPAGAAETRLEPGGSAAVGDGSELRLGELRLRAERG